ncbi:unnamed protein product [Cyprideis torosa]|uniref:Uncharacterized protein n=1 Tax=Cyprideis torosa TaxID=163714 RepID=A0A7R8WLZ0_9CRUS|nr:unnamed protein product [Cyprideis torosa]CAG0903042.1 unnamed protein product [Cyprideis torosa]
MEAENIRFGEKAQKGCDAVHVVADGPEIIESNILCPLKNSKCAWKLTPKKPGVISATTFNLDPLGSAQSVASSCPHLGSVGQLTIRLNQWVNGRRKLFRSSSSAAISLAQPQSQESMVVADPTERHDLLFDVPSHNQEQEGFTGSDHPQDKFLTEGSHLSRVPVKIKATKVDVSLPLQRQGYVKVTRYVEETRKLRLVSELFPGGGQGGAEPDQRWRSPIPPRCLVSERFPGGERGANGIKNGARPSLLTLQGRRAKGAERDQGWRSPIPPNSSREARKGGRTGSKMALADLSWCSVSELFPGGARPAEQGQRWRSPNHPASEEFAPK